MLDFKIFVQNQIENSIFASIFASCCKKSNVYEEVAGNVLLKNFVEMFLKVTTEYSREKVMVRIRNTQEE